MPSMPKPDFTVLQIDDLESNLVLIERILERRPHTKVLSALNGPAGLALAEAEQPDLILLDISMPGMMGDEVLARLKAKPATAGIPVVIFSGRQRDEVVEKMLAEGAVDFLPKPFKVEGLLAVVDHFQATGAHQAGSP
jgi:CheY-like chemotaxis protein